MRKKLFYNIYYLCMILVISIYSCSSGEPEGDKSNFGIYLFDDPNITWESIQGKDLSSYKLKEWITSDMIDFYDYSTHVIYLNVDYNNLFNFTHNKNTPFVVVANDKRCYTGCFGPPADTTQPHVKLTPMDLCTDLIMLEFNPPHRKDIRVNNEVRSALLSSGKLKEGLLFRNEGISFLIDAFGNRLKLYLQTYSAACIRYENDNVYPLLRNFNIIKVGNKQYLSRMVIYNNSVFYSLPSILSPVDTLHVKNISIVDCEKNAYLSSGFYTTDESKYWSVCAFASFNAPQNLEAGVYYCFMEYYGMMGGQKANRSVTTDPPGRVWIGYQRTKTIKFQYDSVNGFKILNTDVVLE